MKPNHLKERKMAIKHAAARVRTAREAHIQLGNAEARLHSELRLALQDADAVGNRIVDLEKSNPGLAVAVLQKVTPAILALDAAEDEAVGAERTSHRWQHTVQLLRVSLAEMGHYKTREEVVLSTAAAAARLFYGVTEDVEAANTGSTEPDRLREEIANRLREHLGASRNTPGPAASESRAFAPPSSRRERVAQQFGTLTTVQTRAVALADEMTAFLRAERVQVTPVLPAIAILRFASRAHLSLPDSPGGEDGHANGVVAYCHAVCDLAVEMRAQLANALAADPALDLVGQGLSKGMYATLLLAERIAAMMRGHYADEIQRRVQLLEQVHRQTIWP
jgi:hypothetical protein